MGQLILFNTLSREQEPVFAADGERLRFYCCGPTVYGPAHIGNFRTFLVQDLFRRVVELTGLPTTHVRNLTDVDDKTIRQSLQEGKPLSEFTAHWTRKFEEDCAALGLLLPTWAPSAVEHIPEQIELIQKLFDQGLAYQAEDGSVYFRVGSFPAYGKLSRLNTRELRTGASGRANLSDEYEKDSVADFALWKSRKPEDGDNAWPSPWGEGRPGWHLECSAMSMKYLGPTFDLHSGGVDLCFPHHENEIAQSEGATGQPFVRHWLHIEHLRVDGSKMSKRLNNLHTVQDIVENGYAPTELRYALLAGYYRQQLNFNFDSLQAARSALKRIDAFDRRLKDLGAPPAEGDFPVACAAVLGEANDPAFSEAWRGLLDDLNTPKALGGFFGELKKVERELDQSAPEPSRLRELRLGLDRFCLAMGFPLGQAEEAAEVVEAPQEIKSMAEARMEAKREKNFAEADRLREEILSQGWEIRDRKDGFDLIQKN